MVDITETGPSIAAEAALFLAVYTASLIFAPKNAHLYRICAALVLGGLTYLLFQALQDVLPRGPKLSNSLMVLTFASFNTAEILLLSSVDADDLARGEKGLSVITLAYRALALFFNLRRVGTKWEVKNLRPVRPQSRMRFVLSKLAWGALFYLLIDAILSGPPPESHLVSERAESLWRLDRLTLEDVVFRLIATLCLWLTAFMCNWFNINLIAIVSVSLGLSTPESCPPVLGLLSSLVSIRAFWGYTFWHQLFRKVLGGWGDFISDSILQIPRGTILSRYTRLFMAFFLSGLVHQAGDIANGLPFSFAMSIRYYSLHALGIMFEDAVQAATRGLHLSEKSRRIVGHLWVIFFFWWTTPSWMYPLIRDGAKGNIVPYSVMERWMK